MGDGITVGGRAAETGAVRVEETLAAQIRTLDEMGGLPCRGDLCEKGPVNRKPEWTAKWHRDV